MRECVNADHSSTSFLILGQRRRTQELLGDHATFTIIRRVNLLRLPTPAPTPSQSQYKGSLGSKLNVEEATLQQIISIFYIYSLFSVHYVTKL